MCVCLQSLPEVKTLLSGSNALSAKLRWRYGVLETDLEEEADFSAVLRLPSYNNAAFVISLI